VNLNCVTNRVAPGSRYRLSYGAERYKTIHTLLDIPYLQPPHLTVRQRLIILLTLAVVHSSVAQKAIHSVITGKLACCPELIRWRRYRLDAQQIDKQQHDGSANLEGSEGNYC
jgi:hypothetical protein